MDNSESDEHIAQLLHEAQSELENGNDVKAYAAIGDALDELYERDKAIMDVDVSDMVNTPKNFPECITDDVDHDQPMKLIVGTVNY